MQRYQAGVAPAPRGQVLVIVAVGLVALIAMVGLVIDGGYAWGQQRETQNGADSAAKAGTVVIQSYLADVTAADGGDVGCAIDASELANDIEVETAIYTNYLGDPLVPEIAVGSCGSGATIPTGAQGVKATGAQDFDTYLMGIVGISEMTARADATAVVGPEEVICPADAGCAILPVTFPHRAVICDGSNRQLVIGEGDWEIHELDDPTTVLTQDNLSVIPLCTTAPGSVGWLDLGCAPNLASAIDDPCNLTIPYQVWLGTQTGNTNSLENNLEIFTGPQVGVPEDEDLVFQIPIHDNTCETDVDGPDNDPNLYSTVCPEGDWSGQGSNLAYHVPYWQGFKMDGVYTGGDDDECNEAPGLPMGGGNGGTGCFKGWFVSRTFGSGFISTGQVDPGQPGVNLGVILVN